MKSKYHFAALGLLVLLSPFLLFAQDDSGAVKKLSLNLAYYMQQNKLVYLIADAKSKTDGKFKPVKGIALKLFLDADSANNLIGTAVTDAHGLAKFVLPPSVKPLWDAASTHNFLAVSAATQGFEETTAEISATKSKIEIDTSSDGETRNITVSVKSYNGEEWTPEPDVELKVGVARSAGSILPGGDEASYTTDSSGSVTLEFTKHQVPGDAKGNILLAARVEDNEKLGNLYVEKPAAWGVPSANHKGFFDQRTLWSTGFKTPLWLLFMAFGIILGVWGTIIYLIFQLIKVKRLGEAEGSA